MRPIIPMEPVNSEVIPPGDNWVAQVKWDGVRVLTYFDGQRVQLYNRRGNERTFHYPEITRINTYCHAASVILDGEIIALGSDGKPSFHEVMRRDGIRRMENVARAQKEVPIAYMVFDVLFVDGEWIHNRSFVERSELLEAIITPGEHVQLVSSHADGPALFHVMRQHGMEGIVLKKRDSPYLPGRKSGLWLKVKNDRDLIALIGGFTLNQGVVNAVLLGLYDDEGKFWYIGHAGAGKLSRQEWHQLTEMLRPAVTRERPFVNQPRRLADACWVKPAFPVKVKYAEWTESGTLRQPTIQGVVDTPPAACTFGQ